MGSGPGAVQITSNNTEIIISEIGEDAALPTVSCNTDLVQCCRAGDTGTVGVGEWYYPSGNAVGNQAAGEPFYRVRNSAQVVRLARRELRVNPVLNPSGAFCCHIPTTQGNMTFCVNIGEFSSY